MNYRQILRMKGMNVLKDGLILMYVKDNEVYPIAMTQEQLDTLQLLGKMFEPIKVITDKPQGKVINLVKKGE